MSKTLKFVSLPSMYHLMKGLTFPVAKCAAVLDHALVNFDEQTGVPAKIFHWNTRGGPYSGKPLSLPGFGGLFIEIEQRVHPEKGTLHVAKVSQDDRESNRAPCVFLNMRSISLDIPMRVEIPLRAFIKGGMKLRGTYVVYLHALLSDDGKQHVYYGITKRGWNLRFNEHTKIAFQEGTRRLFPQKLNALIEARVAQIMGGSDDRPKLTGIISALCGVGLDEDAAMDTEEYLVDKYSLSSKHENGLNMLPGGREGPRALHKLSLNVPRDRVLDTDERETLLDEYLTKHPLVGVPNPGIAAKWNDPAYAEAVICARENRLTADQVRRIRYLAALGATVDTITAQTGAQDVGQVRRVIEGRTYGRIK